MTEVYMLDREIETFYRLRPTLVKEEGRFAVIAGDMLLGVFDTYQDALTDGYKERGLDPFLVKQISSVEAVANFTRHLKVA
jgi:hypothetical protein